VNAKDPLELIKDGAAETMNVTPMVCGALVDCVELTVIVPL